MIQVTDFSMIYTILLLILFILNILNIYQRSYIRSRVIELENKLNGMVHRFIKIDNDINEIDGDLEDLYKKAKRNHRKIKDINMIIDDKKDKRETI